MYFYSDGSTLTVAALAFTHCDSNTCTHTYVHGAYFSSCFIRQTQLLDQAIGTGLISYELFLIRNLGGGHTQMHTHTY